MTSAPRRLATTAVALLLLGSCAASEEVAPRCDATRRLAILAQSVPGASYVPCLDVLPAGWTFEGLDVGDDGATIHLESDRAEEPVAIELRRRCDATGATPIPPRDAGVRTYHAVRSLDPRVTGTFTDVFPGGCVQSTYDFDRGAHISLVAELQQVLRLRSRIELRQELRDQVGISLDG